MICLMWNYSVLYVDNYLTKEEILFIVSYVSEVCHCVYIHLLFLHEIEKTPRVDYNYKRAKECLDCSPEFMQAHLENLKG